MGSYHSFPVEPTTKTNGSSRASGDCVLLGVDAVDTLPKHLLKFPVIGEDYTLFGVGYPGKLLQEIWAQPPLPIPRTRFHLPLPSRLESLNDDDGLNIVAGELESVCEGE